MKYILSLPIRLVKGTSKAVIAAFSPDVQGGKIKPWDAFKKEFEK